MRWLRKTNRRSGIFFTILLSYVSILLLPVVIAIFLFQQSEKALIDNSNRANLGLLEQVKLVAESRLNEIDKMTLQIALNPKVQWALSDGRDDYVSKQLNFVEIMKELKNVRNTSSIIGDLFIYFKNTETILTATGKSDSQTFFDKILVYKEKNSEWIQNEMFSGSKFKAYFPDTPVKDGNGQKQLFTYVQSLPVGERSGVKGYMAVLIKEEEFERLIGQIEKINNGEIYIVDDHQQVIISNVNDGRLDEEWLSQLENETGYHEFKRNGEALMLSYTAGNNGWKYISVAPKQIVLEQVYKLKNLALMLLLICLIAGAIAAYILAFRSYSPIRDVVSTIMQDNKHIPKQNSNEFDFIKESFMSSFAEKNRLSQTLSEHTPVIKANFLSRLIKGHIEIPALNEDSLKFMDVNIQYDNFSTIIMDIHDSAQFTIADSEKEWALVRFVLTNLSADLIWGQVCIVELDRNRLAVLCNYAEPGEENGQRRNASIEKMKDIIEQRFKMKITIGVSQIHRGIEELGRCYGEAVMALDYRLIYGSGVIIYDDEFADLQQYYYHYPLETEAQLINYARDGDYTNVENLVDQIYEANIRSGSLSPEMGKFLFFDLLGTFVKVMNGLNVSKQDRVEYAVDPVKDLAACATAEEMLLKTKEMYRSICSYAGKEKTGHGDRLYFKITRYIDQHYHDGNLSLSSMAEHFQMSPQYLSSFFKKHSHHNIKEYIANVRMNEAKKMLANHTLTMADIAGRIGYANVVGFIRFFKKYEGVPPGKYRELLDRETHI
ncbi:helix-turn-helix domain-containing protein [Paenibacillus eucommiae]|uniref:AraC-like DNA-binding protein n=1 Tax=Paenibacillus eucommiae TaxID=1355755 RepID=A0ABS4IWK4_9BACL|nr:helix-turn-helix domain-containing protein [Paenibacillus eucommiae]MBP1991972.1 AraC-like DNA-binding protein [Paenibacillus eucommiae]